MATSDRASDTERRGITRRPSVPTSTEGTTDHRDELATLQRNVGNGAVAALVQAKLRVGAVDDPLEHEADRVAKRVVARIEQGQPAPGASADEHAVHDDIAPATTTVRRRATSEAGTAAGGTLDAGSDAAIRGASSGGQALDPVLQRSMESGFGADFSAVRVHRDAGADALNRQLGARAFTTGSDIFFRAGEYDPGSTSGKELLAHELTHVVQQGGTDASATVSRAVQPRVQRKAYDIGSTGEQLEVGFFTSKKERQALVAEAEEIITELKETYGVVVSSSTTIEGIRNEYTDVSKKVRDSLATKAWRIKELRALRRALGYYAAILGANRENSSRKDADQEVTSVGKVKQAIDEDTPAGKLDTTTLGEYFASKKNMGLFQASERFKADFDNVGDQLTGTFVHEIAHGLLAYAIPDFIAETGYWKDRNTELARPKRTEWPATDYGETNAAEDICESAMLYFVDPARLKRDAPLRYAFMKKIGTSWVPAPSQAPQVQPDAHGVEPEVTDTGSSQVPEALEQVTNEIEQILQQVDEPNPEQAGDVDSAPATDGFQTATPTSQRGKVAIGSNR